MFTAVTTPRVLSVTLLVSGQTQVTWLILRLGVSEVEDVVSSRWLVQEGTISS